MEIAEGLIFGVDTKTFDDVYGKCIWEVMSVDGESVKCRMHGGSGPSALEGLVVTDTVTKMKKAFEMGQAWIISRSGLRSELGNIANIAAPPPTAGCFEM